MRAKIFLTFLIFSIFSTHFFAKTPNPVPWGFFGHKLINRLAVFTLPPEMIGFYKKHIEFVTEHAVDPDKRRYATKHEAPRHFMDLDRYGEPPFDDLPRKWNDAIARFSDVYLVTERGDTVLFIDHKQTKILKREITFKSKGIKRYLAQDSFVVNLNTYRWFSIRNIESQFYEDEMIIAVDSLRKIFPISGKFTTAFAREEFSHHGIVPYHLEMMQRRLTEAFRQKDAQKILRLSAEFGHYIGDAHVPLHTTENYNGQLSNQHGIHGFWESRIPELFSNEYDFWVGTSRYIDRPNETFWGVVLRSHELVDSVLSIEKRLSQTFPTDQITCLEDRLGATVKTQCEAYARAFSDRLAGQVEARMRDAILMVGNVWYTAWVDAGQPNLNNLDDATATDKNSEDETNDKASQSGKSMIGRGENE